MKQSVSLITLGVSDYEKANAFYAALAWQPVLEIEETAFFQANGVVLVLWARQKLAADSAIADDGARWGGITLAHNVASAAEVDAVIERAREAGGTITREPSKTFYGGYAGVFRDLDGHAWEIAHNPGFGLGRQRQRHPPRRSAVSLPHRAPRGEVGCREPRGQPIYRLKHAPDESPRPFHRPMISPASSGLFVCEAQPQICRRSQPMSLARVQQFSISLDGFGTGEPQSRDAPFGHAGERLHEWMFATRWWGEMVGRPGGSGGIDDTFLRLHDSRVGAEILGAGKFGYPGWHEDPGWKGWWGANPPFHTPVFVLTHHPRPSIQMEGGTTYHFIDASPAEALAAAREAAQGQDVRIGGGATIIRDFLAAGLVDHMHIVVVPILLGRGVRLWDGLESLENDYEVEAVSSPSGVTHVTFTRAGA